MDLLFLMLFPSGIGPAEEAMRVLRPVGPASNDDTEPVHPACEPAVPSPSGRGSG
jgi:hypothetical protein